MIPIQRSHEEIQRNQVDLRRFPLARDRPSFASFASLRPCVFASLRLCVRSRRRCKGQRQRLLRPASRRRNTSGEALGSSYRRLASARPLTACGIRLTVLLRSLRSRPFYATTKVIAIRQPDSEAPWRRGPPGNQVRTAKARRSGHEKTRNLLKGFRASFLSYPART